MGIGLDIKEVLVDVGVAFSILRDSGTLSGEYLDYETNRQVTKPFIREYFLEATLPYDTRAIPGDIIKFDKTGDNFILVNKSVELFENDYVAYEGVLYKCNVSGEIRRYSGEGWSSQTYENIAEWETIKTNVYALLTERLYGADLNEEDFGQLKIAKNDLYIPAIQNIQVLDRYVPASGEYYKVTTVERNKFNKVDVCRVEEDTRQ